jgi:hypothetical protein
MFRRSNDCRFRACGPGGSRRAAALALAVGGIVVVRSVSAGPLAVTSIFAPSTPGTYNYDDNANWLNTPAIAAYPNNNADTTFNAVIAAAGVGNTFVQLSTNITVGGFEISNATLVGTAPDATTVQANPVSITVTGAFTEGPNSGPFNLSRGAVLDLAGTTTLATLANTSGGGVTIDGDPNTAVNIPVGAVLNSYNGSTSFNGPLFTVGGTINNTGQLSIHNGGLQTGTFNALGGTLGITGDFSTAATVTVANLAEVDFYCTPGTHVVPGIDGTAPGHEFSGTVNAIGINTKVVFDDATAYGGPAGASSYYFDSSSHVAFGTGADLSVPTGQVSFNDPDSLNIATAELNNAVTFRTTGLAVGALNLGAPAQGVGGSSTPKYRFESTNGTAATAVNQTGGILLTGQDDGLPLTPVNAGNYNLSGGAIDGQVVITGTFNWTGGVIGGAYGDVVIEPGAKVNTSGTGGLVQQQGHLQNLGGTVTTALPVTVGNSPSANNSLFQQSSGTTTINSVLGIGNDGTITGGGSTAKGTANISGGTVFADTILLGNTTGGSGTLIVSGTGQVTVGGGILLNDAVVTGGSLTVQMNQSTPAGQDPELDNSIVGGYLRNGTLNVSGGTVTSPMIKLGITPGYTGTYDQTGGAVNLSTLTAGNDNSFNTGSGSGSVNLSGGTLNVGTVLLGSNAGGSGTWYIGGTAAVTVTNGVSTNDTVVTGGSLTVQMNISGGGLDPVLTNSLVAGYQKNGEFDISGGITTSPYMKLGVTPGNTGTLLQTGGTILISTQLQLGNNGSSPAGTGTVSITAGNLTAASVLAGSPNGGSGSITVGGTGVLSVGGQLTALAGSSVTINSGGLVTLQPHGSSNLASAIASLAINNGGTLDLTNNALDLPGGSLSEVAALVAQGYNNGTWTGTGITSSTAANDPKHLFAVAVISNNDGSGNPLYYNTSTGLTNPPDPKKLGLFAGDSPGLNDVLVATTYYGDLNLDGKVDGSDYSRIDNGYATSAGGWINGDVNNDGVVDGTDYALMDNAYNNQGAALGPSALVATVTAEVASAPAAVPEPAGLAILAAVVAGTLTRRRSLSR